MPEIDRPDPDLLLRQVEAEDPGRGRLKLYLGMAAGVGKTYTMLADAQEAAKRGVDVALGYLEPHGRAETEELAEGLEQIPLATVEHGGIQLKEFNIDAALARRPGLLLLDELAHTNAPGVRHKKRWQDA
ncbi:MAG: sensor histidine kinase KdpD, partial [Armatimonadetes bacterium]|nr:sensor histidine kinase KdpD [Armatimonadota bacterium]